MKPIKVALCFLRFLFILVAYYAFTLLTFPLKLVNLALWFYFWSRCDFLEDEAPDSNSFVEQTKKEKEEEKIDSFIWVNQIIKFIWKDFRLFAQDQFEKLLWPTIVDELNDTKFSMMWTEIVLEEFDIGEQPIKLAHLRTKAEQNDLVLDIEFSYHGSASFTVRFNIRGLKISVTLQNIRVKKAKARIVLKKWTDQPPFISGLHFGFIEAPDWDWDINHLAGIADIPGFDELILHIINVRLTNRVILPRMLILPIDLAEPVIDWWIQHGFLIDLDNSRNSLMIRPKGIIQVAIKQGENLPGKKFETFKLCTSLGDQSYEAIVIKDDNWSYKSHFSMERLLQQKIVIRMTSRRFNGVISEEVEKIAKVGRIHDWYQLENCSGMLKISFEYLPITNKKCAISERRAFGVISVLLKRIVSDEKIRPIVQIELRGSANSKKWTSLEPLCTSKVQNINEGFLMLVSNVLDENSSINFKVWDAKRSKWIGKEANVQVKSLLSQPIKGFIVPLEKDRTHFQFALSLYHF